MTSPYLSRWIWQKPGWPAATWDLAALAVPLAAARRAQGEAAAIGRLADPARDPGIRLELLTREGLATAGIDGETLDAGVLRGTLARRLGLPDAVVPGPARFAEGLADLLLDPARNLQEPLTAEQLCAWQAALFPAGRSGRRAIRAGVLRGDEPMRLLAAAPEAGRLRYLAPPRPWLEGELRRFLAWFNTPPPGLDGLLRAGLAHAWFELLRPFEGGNGRVGRAVLDRALAQDEGRPERLYSVSARLLTVRDDYFAALERLGSGSLDVTDWLRWFLEQFTHAVRCSAPTIERALDQARFWVRHAALPLNERQRKALGAMLAAGADAAAGSMTNRRYTLLTGASAATAQRDLAELVELGCVTPAGGGRSVRYVLPD